MSVDYTCRIGWGVPLSEICDERIQYIPLYDQYTGLKIERHKEKKYFVLKDTDTILDDIQDFIESKGLDIIYCPYVGADLDETYVGKFEQLQVGDSIETDLVELEFYRGKAVNLLKKLGVCDSKVKYIVYFYND